MEALTRRISWSVAADAVPRARMAEPSWSTAEEDRGLLAGHTRGQRELHDGVGETGKVLLGDTDRGTELTDTGDLLEGDRRVLRDLLEALQQTDGSGFRLANHSGDLRERLLLGDRGCGHGRGHLGEHIEERLEGALQLTHGVAQGERGARVGDRGLVGTLGRLGDAGPRVGQGLLLLGDALRGLRQLLPLDGQLLLFEGQTARRL